MNFEHPDRLLWLAALLPLLGLSLWATARAAQRRTRLLGTLAPLLAPRFSRGRRLMRDGLLLLAVGFGVVALSGPLVGTWMREILRRGVDVMVVLDTSRSMLARDMGSSRLERAKRDIRGLLENLRGHRVGLVTFAGNARRIVPLTHDPSSYRLFLEDVDETTNSFGGTAIGEGLELALDAFDPELPHQRVIVLLTDGEDHTSDPAPTEIAYEALAKSAPIHVVAYGTAEGAPIVSFDTQGNRNVVRDEDGQPVITRPDERLLAKIAEISGGAFLSAERTPFPLDEIWDKRIALMEGVTRASSTREEGVNRFQWALMAALLCLAARAVTREGRRLPPADRGDSSGAAVNPRSAGAAGAPSSRGPVAAALAVLAIGWCAPSAAADDQRGLVLARQARRALLAGDLRGAAKKLEQARVEWPGEPLLETLQGDLEVAEQQWGAAHAAYGASLEAVEAGTAPSAQGPRRRHALFNRGVSAVTDAEAALAAAGVPLDPQAIPEDAQAPQLVEAIEANLPKLQGARDDFVAANDSAADAATRQSIAALNERIDDLEQMLADLREQQENEEDEGEDGEEGDPSEDSEPQEGDDQSGDEQQPPQDQPPEGDESQEPEEEQEQEEPQDADPSEDEEQEQPDESESQPTPGEQPQAMSNEQMQRILDKLEELEERAREIQKFRAAYERKAPVKDW